MITSENIVFETQFKNFMEELCSVLEIFNDLFLNHSINLIINTHVRVHF